MRRVSEVEIAVDTLNHILLATDGSDHALHAARFAGMLSRSTGTDVTIVSVHNDDAVMLNAMGPAIWPATVAYSSMTVEEIRNTVEENAAQTILPATEKACEATARRSRTRCSSGAGQVAEIRSANMPTIIRSITFIYLDSLHGRAPL